MRKEEGGKRNSLINLVLFICSGTNPMMWVIHPYSSDFIAFGNGRLLFRHPMITLRHSSNES